MNIPQGGDPRSLSARPTPRDQDGELNGERASREINRMRVEAHGGGSSLLHDHSMKKIIRKSL